MTTARAESEEPQRLSQHLSLLISNLIKEDTSYLLEANRRIRIKIKAGNKRIVKRIKPSNGSLLRNDSKEKTFITTPSIIQSRDINWAKTINHSSLLSILSGNVTRLMKRSLKLVYRFDITRNFTTVNISNR